MEIAQGRKSRQAAAGADEDDEEAQEQPLMRDEPVAGEGRGQSYAHRDIKPGMWCDSILL